jgi:signal transduction histidine kinase
VTVAQPPDESRWQFGVALGHGERDNPLALSDDLKMLVSACRYAQRAVLVLFRREGANWMLSVADDGPGIPEIDREAVFKPFTCLDDSRNRKTGSYGLGLAIVARIAARHGGSVRAEVSELGGATIVVIWPAVEARLEPVARMARTA